MSQTARRIYTDRSRKIDSDRCKRLRWWGYHAGSQHRGLQPVRKSIHLVIGGAVHSGLEVLLREGQNCLNIANYDLSGNALDLTNRLDRFFNVKQGSYQLTDARLVEDEAVRLALAELSAMTKLGVELDMNEQAGTQQAVDAASGVKIDFSEASYSAGSNGGAVVASDSPIMIDFSDAQVGSMGFSQGFTPQSTVGEVFGGPVRITSPTSFGDALDASVKLERESAGEVVDWSKPIYEVKESVTVDDAMTAVMSHQFSVDKADAAGQSELANAQAASGIDSYLKEELASLVEGMVRAYSRRRLRPLLEQFEVLEVEREGQWKLAELQDHKFVDGLCSKCGITKDRYVTSFQVSTGYEPCAELWFMSRLDALLLERSTNSLYLQSYKTTGQWDRRKAAEAEIDMQGLSEAVDVELRLGRVWNYIHTGCAPTEDWKVEDEVEPRIHQWLMNEPSPPRVLGVRYEYLIKGPRRQDDKDAQMPGRYVADSPLCRTYSQAGITADDRRWAASYSWYNLAGQNKRLDYRSWQKVPVWRYMSIAAWIDLLDSGKVQPEAYDKAGLPVDVLAEQFVAPIHVYRNDDDMRDMLEQLEASEVKIVQDVAAVQAVEHDPVLYRSELNKRFPQNRSACIYPGRCFGFSICFGGADIRQNPEQHSELYQIRSVANHPIEDEVQV